MTQWYSLGYLGKNIFVDEQSLDKSDICEYIYGNLGSFVVPCGDLEDESRHLSGSTRLSNVDDNEVSSQEEDELIDDED